MILVKTRIKAVITIGSIALTGKKRFTSTLLSFPLNKILVTFLLCVSLIFILFERLSVMLMQRTTIIPSEEFYYFYVKSLLLGCNNNKCFFIF